MNELDIAKKDPTNTKFEKWLASKFANYMIMDPFTRKVLWDFWKKDDNKEGVTNEGLSDLEEANNEDEHKITEIFRIETNLFDYETPDHIRGPYANVNTTYHHYLDSRNGRAGNDSNVHEEEEQHNKGQCDLFDNLVQEPLVCKVRRFDMFKYSFGQEEEYVAAKEYEYDDLTRTNKDTCHAYQEIFCNMDEGWLVTRAE
ncbi:hypothetical protein Tco_0618740 [Tanacetum coccineum]